MHKFFRQPTALLYNVCHTTSTKYAQNTLSTYSVKSQTVEMQLVFNSHKQAWSGAIVRHL